MVVKVTLGIGSPGRIAIGTLVLLSSRGPSPHPGGRAGRAIVSHSAPPEPGAHPSSVFTFAIMTIRVVMLIAVWLGALAAPLQAHVSPPRDALTVWAAYVRATEARIARERAGADRFFARDAAADGPA